jgi:hypothetical protein
VPVSPTPARRVASRPDLGRRPGAQDASRGVVEHAACVGEPNATAVPFEEPRADVRLELICTLSDGCDSASRVAARPKCCSSATAQK